MISENRIWLGTGCFGVDLSARLTMILLALLVLVVLRANKI